MPETPASTPAPAAEEPRDFGREAHHKAQAHLTAIAEAWEYQEYADEYEEHDYDEDGGRVAGEDYPDYPDDMAGAWCGGCDDCYIREVLHAAWPILLEAAVEELADRLTKATNTTDTTAESVVTSALAAAAA